LRVTVLLWHSPPGTLLLYGAAAVHISLALLAVYERRTLRMPPLQALRIALGLTMPIALIGHFIATRYAFERFALPAEYSRVVAGLWASGASGLALGLLAPGWIHGSLGLRYAFGHRRTWQRFKPVLFAVALLLPVLAGVGFVTMGRALEAQRIGRAPPPPAVDAHQSEVLHGAREGALLVYLALVAWIGVGRGWRSVAERRNRSVVWISYPNRTVSVPRGWTVLEASRSFGIPHEALCGGRARCTTCRVRVVDGASHCPPPAHDERRALDRIAVSSPDVRLACQLRPTGDIGVEPLVSVAHLGQRTVPQPLRAKDHDAALLLVDVSIETGSAAPSTAACDTIHALDRCLGLVAATATATGADLHKQSASSWLLVFRAAGGLAGAASRALAAADRIAAAAERLSASLADELGLGMRAALVLHAGRIAVGSIGTEATAVAGQPVDDIERLWARLPPSGASFTISRDAAEALGIGDDAGFAAPPAQEPDADAARTAWAAASLATLVARPRSL
jgi:adenylate cyclase